MQILVKTLIALTSSKSTHSQLDQAAKVLSELDERYPSHLNVKKVSTHVTRMLKGKDSNEILEKHNERLRVETSDLAREVVAGGLNTSTTFDEDGLDNLMRTLDSISI